MVFLMDVCKDCRYCRTGRESLCLGPGFVGFSTSGGYAEKIAVSAGHSSRSPTAWPTSRRRRSRSRSGRPGTCSSLAAVYRPGETVLVNSVGSGIGSAAVQLASIAGATIIGTASSDEKLERAAELGMHHGINYREQDVVEEVMRLTDDRGADLAYEHVGGDLFQKALDSLGKDGRLVICGGHGGEVVPFDIIPFFRSQKRSSAPSSTTATRWSGAWRSRSEVRSRRSSTRCSRSRRRARRWPRMERREHFGKIVLTP